MAEKDFFPQIFNSHLNCTLRQKTFPFIIKIILFIHTTRVALVKQINFVSQVSLKFMGNSSVLTSKTNK
jgi:hypothetical protein